MLQLHNISDQKVVQLHEISDQNSGRFSRQKQHHHPHRGRIFDVIGLRVTRTRKQQHREGRIIVEDSMTYFHTEVAR
jgi:hypothetical protein